MVCPICKPDNSFENATDEIVKSNKTLLHQRVVFSEVFMFMKISRMFEMTPIRATSLFV
ncbi:MAG: hypothetical protein FWE82_06320 [Defluviitaleaceae bacterium]|nr:hypothetical protein [Defluviitaleaceae bacterium]